MKRAVVLGAGGLGCPAALALVESNAPVELVLIDDDRVERSNLARQILFRELDLGQPKAEAAARALRDLAAPGGPAVRGLVARLVASNAASLIEGAAVVLDGTDNFETRFLVNDTCLAAGVPLVHGAVLGWTGQLLTVLPGRSACLRCFFEGPPPAGALPTCAEAGAAAPLCGLVGAAMAQAALQVLEGRARAGLLQRWDGRTLAARPLQLKRDPSCRCGILPPCPSP